MVTAYKLSSTDVKIVEQDYWETYITKGLTETAKVRPVGKRLVYVSQGLDRPKIVAKAPISVQDEKKIAKIADKRYSHMDKDTGKVYGATYIADGSWASVKNKVASLPII